MKYTCKCGALTSTTPDAISYRCPDCGTGTIRMVYTKKYEYGIDDCNGDIEKAYKKLDKNISAICNTLYKENKRLVDWYDSLNRRLSNLIDTYNKCHDSYITEKDVRDYDILVGESRNIFKSIDTAKEVISDNLIMYNSKMENAIHTTETIISNLYKHHDDAAIPYEKSIQLLINYDTAVEYYKLYLDAIMIGNSQCIKRYYSKYYNNIKKCGDISDISTHILCAALDCKNIAMYPEKDSVIKKKYPRYKGAKYYARKYLGNIRSLPDSMSKIHTYMISSRNVVVDHWHDSYRIPWPDSCGEDSCYIDDIEYINYIIERDGYLSGCSI